MADAAPGTDTSAASGGVAEPSAALVREPQQARSRRTLRRILDTSFHILEQEGPDALTVTGITKRARTSVGSFYARFDGKEDLLRYLGERSLEQAAEEWEEVRAKLAPGADLRTAVRDVVTGLSWLYLEGAGRALVMLHGIEDPPPRRRRRLEDRIAQDLRAVLPTSDVRSNLATRIVTGVLHDVALQSRAAPVADGEGSPYPHTPVLLSELVELVVGYLGGEVQVAASEPTRAPEPAPVPPEPEPEVSAEPVHEAEPEPAVAESPWDAPAGELAIPREWEPEPAEEEPEPTAPPEPAPAEPVSGAAPEPEELEPGPAPEPSPEEAEEVEPDPFDVWG